MTIVHLSVDERVARGKAARKRVSPSDHDEWVPGPNRPDPIALLEAQNATRGAFLASIPMHSLTRALLNGSG